MPEIGVISARITADDREFQRAFKRARGGIRDLAQRFRTAATRAAQFSAVIGAVAVAVGTRLVNAQMKAIQSTNRLVDISGIHARTIEALRLQSQKYGVAQERANDAVIDFSERLGEARTGTGEAVDGFELLERASGRSIDLGKNVNAVWRDFVAAMGEVADKSDRAAIAAQIGGDALRDLLPVLSQGKEGFDEASQAVEDLGLAFSKIEGQQVQQASAAISRAQLALSGVARTATIELAPIIEHLADRFVDASKEAGGFREQILSGMEGAAVAVAHVSNAVRGFQIAWQGVRLSFEGLRLLIMKGLEEILQGIRDLSNQAVRHVNTVIDKFNQLPFVNIEAARAIESGPLESAFRNQAQQARDNIDSIIVKMNELAMEGAKPEQVRKFFQTLREESRKAAEEAGGAVGGGGGDGEEGEGGLGQKEREKQEERLNAIRESLMTERELQMEHFEAEQEVLRKSLENELLTRKEFKTLSRELEQQHQDKLTEIEKRGLSDREKFERASLATKFQMASSHMSSMTSMVAGQNKKLFRINKAAALSEATISSIKGINTTWNAYPYPWNIPMTAAHAATAFANVQKIRSQSFGGAGGTTAPSVAAGTPAGATPTAAAGGGQQGPTREATFNITGDTFGPDAIEKIAESLNEFAGDNGDLRVNVRRAA